MGMDKDLKREEWAGTGAGKRRMSRWENNWDSFGETDDSAGEYGDDWGSGLPQDVWQSSGGIVVDEREITTLGRVMNSLCDGAQAVLQKNRSVRSSSNPWDNLTNAVVLQAVVDYCKACESLQYHRSQRAEKTRQECEEFFRSDRFRLLTGLDADRLLKLLDTRRDAVLRRAKRKKTDRERTGNDGTGISGAGEAAG